MSNEHQIPCPKCHKPLRHRVISNLYWCANENCTDYKGIPAINVSAQAKDMMDSGKDLRNAFRDELWDNENKK